MMEAQEIFNIVARHLLKQWKKSIDGLGTCLYRSPDGSKCAIGCLMPDNLYRPEFEGRAITELPRVVLQAISKPSMTGFLYNLQNLHDEYAVETWPRQLRLFAEHYALSTAVLEETAS